MIISFILEVMWYSIIGVEGGWVIFFWAFSLRLCYEKILVPDEIVVVRLSYIKIVC